MDDERKIPLDSGMVIAVAGTAIAAALVLNAVVG